MPGARWYSQPNRPDKRVLGAASAAHVEDDDIRALLEQMLEDLRYLQSTCPSGKPVYGLRAHCWQPDLTRPMYGAHYAHYNTCVLIAPVAYDGAEGVKTCEVRLPDAVGKPGGSVEVVDHTGTATTTNITIKTIKGQTINGAATYTMNTAYAAALFRSDGQNWRVISNSAGGSTPSSADHGGLSGLADDDHTQYHNNTRGDARYTQKSNNLSDVSSASTSLDNLGVLRDALTADDSASSTTTYANTSLSLTMLASTRYLVNAVIFIEETSSGGFKLRFNGGAITATSMRVAAKVWEDGNTTPKTARVMTSLSDEITQAGLGDTAFWVELSGTIDVGTGGAFTVEYARNAGVGSATPKEDSNLQATRL